MSRGGQACALIYQLIHINPSMIIVIPFETLLWPMSKAYKIIKVIWIPHVNFLDNSELVASADSIELGGGGGGGGGGDWSGGSKVLKRELFQKPA